MVYTSQFCKDFWSDYSRANTYIILYLPRYQKPVSPEVWYCIQSYSKFFWRVVIQILCSVYGRNHRHFIFSDQSESSLRNTKPLHYRSQGNNAIVSLALYPLPFYHPALPRYIIPYLVEADIKQSAFGWNIKFCISSLPHGY